MTAIRNFARPMNRATYPQTTNTILMIRPVAFGFNEQTAASNAFQTEETAGNFTAAEINSRAIREFDAMVAKLRENGIDVLVVEDTPDPHTPDSIFPNNWMAFHRSGQAVLFPMEAENRRTERRADIFEMLRTEAGFRIDRVVDMTTSEREGRFLEGTGSVVWDRRNGIAYACRSSRTDETLLRQYAETVGGRALVFDATDSDGQSIYHTNVLMCVGETFVVICLNCIRNASERDAVVASFEQTGHEIIEISEAQMSHYAGNMLQVQDRDGQPILVMSQQAYDSLEPTQIKRLEAHCPILPVAIPTIEHIGGGSARCMMAEVFLPKL